jgi:hypothetical protein
MISTPFHSQVAQSNSAAANMTIAFDSILTAGSIETAKTIFTESLTVIGANVASAGALIDALAAIDAVLVVNASESQKTQISETIAVFIGSFVTFVQSQPGLENVATDQVILNDPQFSTFASDFAKLAQQMEEVRARTSTAPEFFPGVTGTLGEFFVRMTTISKLVVERKSSGL